MVLFAINVFVALSDKKQFNVGFTDVQGITGFDEDGAASLVKAVTTHTLRLVTHELGDKNEND